MSNVTNTPLSEFLQDAFASPSDDLWSVSPWTNYIHLAGKTSRDRSGFFWAYTNTYNIHLSLRPVAISAPESSCFISRRVRLDWESDGLWCRDVHHEHRIPAGFDPWFVTCMRPFIFHETLRYYFPHARHCSAMCFPVEDSLPQQKPWHYNGYGIQGILGPHIFVLRSYEKEDPVQSKRRHSTVFWHESHDNALRTLYDDEVHYETTQYVFMRDMIFLYKQNPYEVYFVHRPLGPCARKMHELEVAFFGAFSGKHQRPKEKKALMESANPKLLDCQVLHGILKLWRFNLMIDVEPYDPTKRIREQDLIIHSHLLQE